MKDKELERIIDEKIKEALKKKELSEKFKRLYGYWNSSCDSAAVGPDW